jgi:glutamine amidotransferase
MTVAIVKYNAGNIHSVINALERLRAKYVLTDDAEVLSAAERVIFPGVGEASSAMRYLRERKLDSVLRSIEAPFLGICLGQQLMCTYSEENETECLDIIPGRVRRFTLPKKVPHMGWSRVRNTGHALFRGIEQDSYFYFVHSYRADPSIDTIAECSYEENFSAALAKDNFAGVQFHPEKSGAAGQRLLANFLEWRP